MMRVINLKVYRFLLNTQADSLALISINTYFRPS